MSSKRSTPPRFRAALAATSALMVLCAAVWLTAGPASAEDEQGRIRLVILPHTGPQDVRQALSVGQRIFEARLSTTGRFVILGDRETEQLFDQNRERTGVSPAEEREAQLRAAQRSYADWAIGIDAEEVGSDEYLVSLAVWDPQSNERLHSDSELVDSTSSINAAARVGIDALAQRFLVSPLVLGESNGRSGPTGGRLDVYDVQPVPMRVLVNGEQVGLAPGQFTGLPLGPVQVELAADGHASQSRTVELSATERVEISGIRLEVQPAQIAVQANVDGAEIIVGEETVGVTQAGELVTIEVPASARSIRVVKSGYLPYRGRLDLTGNTTQRVEVTLERHDGPSGLDVSSADCTQTSEADGARLCLVPAGSFVMGSQAGASDARPQREVGLNDSYRIYETEVTVAMYRRCVEAGECPAPNFEVTGSEQNAARSYDIHPGCNYGAPGTSDAPMNCINWHGAEAYCEWAGGQLPTEAQWEKAARGVDGRVFPWAAVGDAATLDCGHALHAGCPAAAHGTAPVGERAAGRSPYGMQDAAGNVAEWVRDTYEAGAYQTLHDQDPVSETASSRRVVRGGSYREFDDALRAFHRARLDANARPDHIGFRCVIVE